MANLTYRDLGPDDFTVMHAIATERSVVRQLGGWPWPPNPEFTKSRCKHFGGKGFVWGICLDGALVGSVAVTGRELGYMLHPSASGRGIMTQAAVHAINHAIATTDHAYFDASYWHDNPASGHVLAKLGFRHWQTRYEPSKARRIPLLCHYTRLQRADWHGLSKPPQ
ncbi:MAG: GNAT family N-acetyltransferase [Yoonia sp.]|nr:GNAT family N-acetyltransferase [Yoonia sp.]